MDLEGWLAEVRGVREYYEKFGDRVPKELEEELVALKRRLQEAR